MSIASKAATSLVRQAARQQAPSTLCSSSVAMQKRTQASATDASTSHAQWNSPFSRGTSGQQDTTKIPSFKAYKNGSETANKVFQYFMVGTLGGLSAMGAKDTVASESGYTSHRSFNATR
jgi:ubiquinol-cytochrome c reductase iron-sulfur subunit